MRNGPFVSNEQRFEGRPVSVVVKQGGVLSSSITAWDCPARL
jgi:hypothetical protein